MNREATLFYTFGPFRFDPRERLLLHEGRPVALPPKVIETLFLLVQSAGHLVTKDELMKKVWPDAFVEDGNLNKSVSTLRKVLRRFDCGQEYIETVPKRGYRFLVAVNEIQEIGPGPYPAVQEADRKVPPDQGERKRWSLLVSTAVLIAALTSVAFVVHRPARFGEKDTIVIADFINTTEENVFDVSLQQALETELAQSPFINVLPQESARETLLYMGRSPEDRITAATAKEICERRALKAMLSGSISSLGRNYIIGLEVRSCRTGDLLAEQQVQVQGKEEVLHGLDKAVSSLRAQLGESLTSIRNFDSPIDQATTPSLEALHAYSLAQRQRARGVDYEAIPFLKTAIELDPNFAMANATLGVMYDHLGDDVSVPSNGIGPIQDARSSAINYLSKAFELRDRVSQKERFYISAHYYEGVTHELDKQNEIYELWKQIYPQDPVPYTNLGANFADIGNYEAAADNAAEAVRLAPNNAFPYAALANAYLGLDQLREAKAVCEKAVQKRLDGRGIQWLIYEIAFAQNDVATMQRQLEWAKINGEAQGSFVFEGSRAAHSGKLREARQLFDASRRTADAMHDSQTALSVSIRQALIEVQLGYPQRVNDPVGRRNEVVAPPERETLALALALAGRADRAQELIDLSLKRFPQDTFLKNVLAPSVRAAIEINQHNASRAVDVLWSAAPYELGRNAALLPIYLRGKAYLELRHGKEAAVEFQKIIDHPSIAPFSLVHVLALPGLADAYALQGDIARSRAVYQQFFDSWKDADVEIPILEQAKANYAKLL
jgi:DNA-binding winged helix-turn-helix (wHTH) protein/tetratricopeptide (TPR) repeat protein